MTTLEVKKESAVGSGSQERFCMILSEGSLDMVYPTLTLAHAAATMGSEAPVPYSSWWVE